VVFQTETEEYDGSTWTSNPTGLNTARNDLAGCGTQTAALAFGGEYPIKTATEEYDGSTWTSNPTGLNTARDALAGVGTQTSALAFGGITDLLQLGQQKNMMELLGQQSYWFKYRKIWFKWSRYSNRCIRIWW
jgi:hypothetical protein